MLKIKKIFKNELLKITIGISLIWFIAASLIYNFEKNQNGEMFSSFADALWWSIISITTTGYGDKFPITPIGRIMAGTAIVTGVVVFSMLTATISSIFVERKMKARMGLRPTKFRNHIIICGWNPFVEEILRIFSLNVKNKKFSIVLVNDFQPDKMQSIIETFTNLEIDFVKGDYTLEQTLYHANIKSAETVLIVPNINFATGILSDEKTLHGVLTIKNINSNLKVFVHLTNPENYSHVKRANADEIILSDQHVGVMLANNIIFPGATQVTLDLLDYEKGNDIHRVEIPKSFIGKKFEDLMIDFKRNRNWTIISIVKDEEKMNLSDMLSSTGTGIDNFIERKFRDAGINIAERSGLKLNINPDVDYIIEEKDFAIVIGSVDHKNGQ